MSEKKPIVDWDAIKRAEAAVSELLVNLAQVGIAAAQASVAAAEASAQASRAPSPTLH